GVDVLLVQRPADALGDAALELPLDVAGMDGAADILHGGIPDHARDAELDIDLDVADMRTEAAFGALSVELNALTDWAAHRRRLVGKLGKRQRLERASIRACRMGSAVLPLPRFWIDLPNLRGALAQRVDDLLGRLSHHHGGREQHAAAAG